MRGKDNITRFRGTSSSPEQHQPGTMLQETGMLCIQVLHIEHQTSRPHSIAEDPTAVRQPGAVTLTVSGQAVTVPDGLNSLLRDTA